MVGGVSDIWLPLFLQSVLLSFLTHLLNAVISCADHSIGKVSFFFLFLVIFFCVFVIFFKSCRKFPTCISELDVNS